MTSDPSSELPDLVINIVLFGIGLHNRHKTFAKHKLTLNIEEFQQEGDKVHGMETVPDGQEGQGTKLRCFLAAEELETLKHIVLAPEIGVDVECSNDVIDRGGSFKGTRECIC